MTHAQGRLTLAKAYDAEDIYLDGHCVARDVPCAAAAELVRRWNAHADFLAALEGLLPMAEALLRVGMAFRDRPAWMVEQDKYGMDAVGAARAAIARARGEG